MHKDSATPASRVRFAHQASKATGLTLFILTGTFIFVIRIFYLTCIRFERLYVCMREKRLRKFAVTGGGQNGRRAKVKILPSFLHGNLVSAFVWNFMKQLLLVRIRKMNFPCLEHETAF